MTERTIKTTYYGPSTGRNKPKPEIRKTRGSRLGECLPNVTRMLTQNLKGEAVVAEVYDETYDELLLVVTYFPGEKMQVAFERDVSRPVCITTGLGN